MNIQQLDQALINIIKKKNQLSELSYNDDDYDTVEEELHDLEDDFLENYGSFLEDALQVVHDEYCPDNDVLLPIAYLANKYLVTGESPNGTPVFKSPVNEGVIVDVDDFPGRVCRLVFEPNPVRLILKVDKGEPVEVWRTDKK